uniref:Ribonuclease H2 subunit B wHTH domain-containing protein n=1 Tax=Echinococcus canadensis TaxID=519352 RepID=A0A915EY32_9CEST
MNVIFLFIPSLLKMDKFTTLDVLIRSECAPGYPDYFPDSTFDKLCTICESKVTCGLKVLRLNEEKLMDWLNDAVNRIFEAAHGISDYRQMPQLRAILASSSDAAAASGELDNSALKKLAFQIIADKLPYQLVDKLLSSLGLVSLPAADKENDHTEENDELNALRPAINYGNPTEDYLNNVTTAKPIMAKSAAQTRRMKMAKGTRSITSFFCKT